MTAGEPLIRWDWVLRNLPVIGGRLQEHLLLTAIAVSVGLAISLALGIWISRRPAWEAPITWTAGVLYTIPSLALFALLIPFTGLSILTAEIGLVGYTLLILIRNVVAGIRGVPPEVRDAALGMGYAPRQMLWKIELPLALPVIMAGIRVATVTTIGLTTVTALIGQGGLGALITEGMVRFFSTPLIIGAVLSIALAVLADAALLVAQRVLSPWAR